jgi:glutaminyl-tRNA synthetase
VPCEVRLYDRLFTAPDPEADDDIDFREHLNPRSLDVVQRARAEASLAGAEPGARFQFERLGYFMTDLADSRGDALVFNRTVTLRDTWSKLSADAEKKVSDGRPDRSRSRRETAAAQPAEAAQPREPRAAALRAERIPELEARRHRYEAMGIPAEQADVLSRDEAVATLFEQALLASERPLVVAKWMVNEIPREAREGADNLAMTGRSLGELVEMVETGQLSGSAGREVLAVLLKDGGAPADIVEQRGLRQVSDEAALSAAVDSVIAANPGKLDEYRGGKRGLLGFFIGQVMTTTGGRANPAVVRDLVQQRLDG